MADLSDIPHICNPMLYMYQGELSRIRDFIKEVNNSEIFCCGELFGLRTHSGCPVVYFATLRQVQHPNPEPLPKCHCHSPEEYLLDLVGEWIFQNNKLASVTSLLWSKAVNLGKNETKFLIVVETGADELDKWRFSSKLRAFLLAKKDTAIVFRVDINILPRESVYSNRLNRKKCSSNNEQDAIEANFIGSFNDSSGEKSDPSYEGEFLKLQWYSTEMHKLVSHRERYKPSEGGEGRASLSGEQIDIKEDKINETTDSPLVNGETASNGQRDEDPALSQTPGEKNSSNDETNDIGENEEESDTESEGETPDDVDLSSAEPSKATAVKNENQNTRGSEFSEEAEANREEKPVSCRGGENTRNLRNLAGQEIENDNKGTAIERMNDDGTQRTLIGSRQENKSTGEDGQQNNRNSEADEEAEKLFFKKDDKNAEKQNGVLLQEDQDGVGNVSVGELEEPSDSDYTTEKEPKSEFQKFSNDQQFGAGLAEKNPENGESTGTESEEVNSGGRNNQIENTEDDLPSDEDDGDSEVGLEEKKPENAESTGTESEEVNSGGQNNKIENTENDLSSDEDEGDSEDTLNSYIIKKIEKQMPCFANKVGGRDFEITLGSGPMSRFLDLPRDSTDTFTITAKKIRKYTYGITTICIKSTKPGGFELSKICDDSFEEIAEFVVNTLHGLQEQS